MQTLKHKAALRLATGERFACAHQGDRRSAPAGAPGSVRAFVVRGGQTLESIRSAIRQKLGL